MTLPENLWAIRRLLVPKLDGRHTQFQFRYVCCSHRNNPRKEKKNNSKCFSRVEHQVPMEPTTIFLEDNRVFVCDWRACYSIELNYCSFLLLKNIFNSFEKKGYKICFFFFVLSGGIVSIESNRVQTFFWSRLKNGDDVRSSYIVISDYNGLFLCAARCACLTSKQH